MAPTAEPNCSSKNLGWTPRPDTHKPRSGTRNLRPVIRNPRPGTRDARPRKLCTRETLKPWILMNIEPLARNPLLRIINPSTESLHPKPQTSADGVFGCGQDDAHGQPKTLNPNPESRFRNLEPGIRNPKFERRTLNPGSWNPKPKSQTPYPKSLIPIRSRIPSPKSQILNHPNSSTETRNPNPETGFPNPATRTRSQGGRRAGDRDQLDSLVIDYAA